MKVITKRAIYKGTFCLGFGAFLGLICAYMAGVAFANWDSYWGSSIMWGIIYNRILIGLSVFTVSLVTSSGIIKKYFKPWLRGFLVGMMISIDLSIWFLLIDHSAIIYLFVSSLVIGGIYGLLIDHFSSKFFGHGHKLVKEFNL